jgi:hypothetical protein
MERVGSLPCLQKPTTGPDPEPDESNPRRDTQLLKIYCPLIYAYVFRVVSFLQPTLLCRRRARYMSCPSHPP